MAIHPERLELDEARGEYNGSLSDASFSTALGEMTVAGPVSTPQDRATARNPISDEQNSENELDPLCEGTHMVETPSNETVQQQDPSEAIAKTHWPARRCSARIAESESIKQSTAAVSKADNAEMGRKRSQPEPPLMGTKKAKTTKTTRQRGRKKSNSAYFSENISNDFKDYDSIFNYLKAEFEAKVDKEHELAGVIGSKIEEIDELSRKTKNLKDENRQLQCENRRLEEDSERLQKLQHEHRRLQEQFDTLKARVMDQYHKENAHRAPNEENVSDEVIIGKWATLQYNIQSIAFNCWRANSRTPDLEASQPDHTPHSSDLLEDTTELKMKLIERQIWASVANILEGRRVDICRQAIGDDMSKLVHKLQNSVPKVDSQTLKRYSRMKHTIAHEGKLELQLDPEEMRRAVVELFQDLQTHVPELLVDQNRQDLCEVMKRTIELRNIFLRSRAMFLIVKAPGRHMVHDNRESDQAKRLRQIGISELAISPGVIKVGNADGENFDRELTLCDSITWSVPTSGG